MGTFCFDQYEHPLLWCEEKKKFVEKQNADESLRQWRQKKTDETSRKDQEKREIQDMNAKHCPWGRPGGGAPNLDIRRRDITASGLHSTPGTKIIPGLRGSAFPSCRASFDAGNPFRGPCGLPPGRSNSIYKGHHYLPPPTAGPGGGGGGGSSGGGGVGGGAVGLGGKEESFDESATDCGGKTAAEIRSAADRLYITLKDHPSMPNRNKGSVDIELRYKTLPKGKKMLEKIVVTEQPKCPPTSSTKIKKSSGKEDPWGKPGPGGKPWRSQKNVGSNFMRSLGWTNKELLKELDDQNPIKKTPGKQLKKKGSKDDGELRNCCEICTCKCPALNKSESALKKSPTTPKKKLSISKELERKSALKSGSGGGGGGSGGGLGNSVGNICIRDIEPKICPRFLKNCPAMANGNQGVELVPLLARRRGMHRPISLSSTDITKRMPDKRWTKNDVDYLNELATQMSQKRRRNNTTSLNERELCHEHFNTIDTFWGRPGHGAPRDIKHKLNLDDLLYGLAV